MAHSRQTGFLARLAAFFLLLTVVLGLLLMFFLSHILQYGITAKTGFPTLVDELSSNPLRGTLAARNFHIRNPEVFPSDAFLEIGRLQFKLSPASLFRETIEVEHIEVEISQLTGIREPGGRVNFEEFRIALEGLRAADEGGGGKTFAIGRFRLKLDRVLLIDYSGDGLERLQEYEVDLDMSFEDTTSLRLVAPEVLRRLASAGVPFDEDSIFTALVPERYRERVRREIGGEPPSPEEAEASRRPQNRD